MGDTPASGASAKEIEAALTQKARNLTDHIRSCALIWDSTGVSRVLAIVRTTEEIDRLLAVLDARRAANL